MGTLEVDSCNPGLSLLIRKTKRIKKEIIHELAVNYKSLRNKGQNWLSCTKDVQRGSFLHFYGSMYSSFGFLTYYSIFMILLHKIFF